jgi:hypothetical protein
LKDFSRIKDFFDPLIVLSVAPDKKNNPLHFQNQRYIGIFMPLRERERERKREKEIEREREQERELQ